MIAERFKVTVMMTVYNGERFVKETIESVLNQTYKDFEFLIINNGSTDSTVEIISSFKDDRIRLIHNKKNLNLADSRNRCIKEARGEYLAWIDADDVCFPYRLEKQVSVLDASPDVGLCCSDSVSINAEGETISEGTNSSSLVPVEWALIWTNKISQPTVMMRKEILVNNKLYYNSLFPPSEDYDLWLKIALHTKIHFINESLIYYRRYSNSTYEQYFVTGLENALDCSFKIAESLTGGLVPVCHKYLTDFGYLLDKKAGIPVQYYNPLFVLFWGLTILNKASAFWSFDKTTVQVIKKELLGKVFFYYKSIPFHNRLFALFDVMIQMKFDLLLPVVNCIIAGFRSSGLRERGKM